MSEFCHALAFLALVPFLLAVTAAWVAYEESDFGSLAKGSGAAVILACGVISLACV